MRLPAFLLYVKDGRKIRKGPFEWDPADPVCTEDALTMGVELLRRHGLPKPGDQLVLLEVHGDPGRGNVSIEAISFTETEIARMAALAGQRNAAETRRTCYGKTRMAPAFSA